MADDFKALIAKVATGASLTRDEAANALEMRARLLGREGAAMRVVADLVPGALQQLERASALLAERARADRDRLRH